MFSRKRGSNAKANKSANSSTLSAGPKLKKGRFVLESDDEDDKEAETARKIDDGE